MADEREGQNPDTRGRHDRDKITTGGREQNAAKPLDASDNKKGPERYPSARRDDAVEGPGRLGDPATGRR